MRDGKGWVLNWQNSSDPQRSSKANCQYGNQSADPSESVINLERSSQLAIATVVSRAHMKAHNKANA